jgi:hypothetical protein
MATYQGALMETLFTAWALEFCALLPFAYAAKIWNAHYEFIENLSLVIPRA